LQSSETGEMEQEVDAADEAGEAQQEVEIDASEETCFDMFDSLPKDLEVNN